MTSADRPDWRGRVIDVEVGPPGHGGFCIARTDGRVVFVRHALPGERVRAVVTEDAGGGFCRADAVEVLVASTDRVEPPCPHAGAGRCGGCDWQHADGRAQRRLKADVVREQFRRVAGLDIDMDEVEALPGGLLGWRTRMTFAVGADGTTGLHRHRSGEVEPVASCPLAAAAVAAAPAASPGAIAVERALGDDGSVAELVHTPGSGRQARGRRPPDRVRLVSGPAVLRHQVGEHRLQVASGGFWQGHPDAVQVLAEALVAGVRPTAGETVLELYAGAGPLTSVFADLVGATGRVLGIEYSRAAVADAAANLADRDWAEVIVGRVDAAGVRQLDLRPDLVLLDPPRAGAGAATMAAIVELEPRRVGYVSCDPATLARDVAAVASSGWRLASLRAFDAFPMTHHVECVAVLEPVATVA